MGYRSFFDGLRRVLTPILLLVLGLILTFSPMSGPAFFMRTLGWIIAVGGIFYGLSAIVFPLDRPFRIIVGVIVVLTGSWILRHPVAAAGWLGRLIGILLILQGIQGAVYLRSHMGSFVFPIGAIILGVVLVLLPVHVSRVVFRVIGILVTVLGGVMLADRLKDEDPPRDDPDIIDAL